MAQLNLAGEEITFEKIISEKTVYYGTYFCISVTETGEAELERLREGGLSISSWISKHMRVQTNLPEGNEGKCFQKDVIGFTKQLEKGTMETDTDKLTKEKEKEKE